MADLTPERKLEVLRRFLPEWAFRDEGDHLTFGLRAVPLHVRTTLLPEGADHLCAELRRAYLVVRWHVTLHHRPDGKCACELEKSPGLWASPYLQATGDTELDALLSAGDKLMKTLEE